MKHIKSRPLDALIICSLIFAGIMSILGVKLWGSDFIRDFGANWLATFLGLVLGIPIVLLTSKFQDQSIEKERKGKILNLLQKELLVNQCILSGWNNTGKFLPEAILMSGFLKTESWKSFSDGGELVWIKDPKLLNVLSWAYGSIRTVSYVSEKYSSYILAEDPHQNSPKYESDTLYMREMLTTYLAESIELINDGLTAISKAS